ncbi:sigma factor-like helix-turn-helix DNA-binding protein [Streptomyces sp. NBC_00887]|uniref:sigma factor-like helix-turn-helix DNA-binding protein n=1 Tax=Streptomyces sp. NBC_00887 TaxID=2975859 RepID=UPI00386D9575|nr:sigma-70 region 4 domain-containing protein [Streptomyces sp. NBC_00887]WSY36364.1 sigma-70 region 4 domain-containing protein [Streptomyces sp. NBC_00887]
MPVEFTAFCLRHQERYIRYARARSLDAGKARQIVESVLGALVVVWPSVISSDMPSRVAWQVLTAQVDWALLDADRARRGNAGDAAHLALPPRQADAVLLRYRLCLSRAETAELMGVKESEVALDLAKAVDSLQSQDRHRLDATPVFR